MVALRSEAPSAESLEVDTRIVGSHYVLQEAVSYWDGRKAGRRFPRRSDIDPADIPALLPHVFLIDVERSGPTRLRVRLAGSYIETVLKMFVTNRYIDEVSSHPQIRQMLLPYSECAETGQPQASRQAIRGEDGRLYAYARVLLPLAVGIEDRVDMIFGAVAFEDPYPTSNTPSSGIAQAVRRGLG